MVSGDSLSTSLIQLIDSVSSSESESVAIHTLLKSFLEIFKMDQAALFTKENESFESILALDRTGRILKNGPEIFKSETLLESALISLEPLNYKNQFPLTNVPASIKDESLRQIVCLPLTRNPGTAIFLGSKSYTEQDFTEVEMRHFKTAAKAAWLAIRQFKTQEQLSQTQNELKSLKESKSAMVYGSPKIEKVLSEIERVAQFNISVLLLGESGVGKEEVARFLHNTSKRTGAFVAVNCANLTETLLESELFGYRKGAFTGAHQNKDGLFKAADGGTLFLDEIAELPFNLQAKLLRVLQERKIRPVGATHDIPVDVRIVAATHQDLHQKIAEGSFRSDLFYRIHDFIVQIPPLRERFEDIEILAQHFISTASREMNLPGKIFSPQALQQLKSYSWPGNARELKNVCRTSVILSRSSEIQAEDLRIHLRPAAPNSPIIKSALPINGEIIESSVPADQNVVLPLRSLAKNFERQVIQKLFSDGLSQSEVATKLDVSVRTVQRILNDNNP